MPTFSKTNGGALAAPFRRENLRATLWQSALVLGIVAVIVLLALNARSALDARGMTSGFGYLLSSAPFALGEGFFHFEAGETYLAALGVGLGNTLALSAVSILAATLLGTAFGLMRLSANPLVEGVARVYVELFRNTPQLVQIIFWYTFFATLPSPRDALSLAGLGFASNRGLTLPAPADGTTLMWVAVALAAGIAAAVVLSRAFDRRRRRTGRRVPLARLVLAAVVLVPPVAVWALAGFPAGWSVPALKGFNYRGGVTLSPEFLAIYFGLSFYIAAFIAEIVRGGLASVDSGQIEAANAIGLPRADLYRRVVAPQALRVIIPPLSAQYVSLVKNSSLGVAVGYPELFSVSNTMLTYSGRTIEVLCVMAAVYLVISLTISACANVLNALVQIKER
ncbi:amino acid ABC transporter permease [Acuticoccus sp. I52.16.1]|uniref:amino acid ABC transporter permease n=1 Tax=Acuticoccus sp. I52.16.1 TaxID=2928472 RepID=UPI001FD4B087|nr:ABC transporter permease subunit [Acuticoccus sp. I52.16.1]UOM37154.1 ABC transporter permease subunit [Acuticoccus sp. I52.16.1]